MQNAQVDGSRSDKEAKKFVEVLTVVANEVVGYSVWYLPYLVTSQTKKRIVYNGRADINGVCIDDFIKTQLDFLNVLIEIRRDSDSENLK